jgi:hypothetical protein
MKLLTALSAMFWACLRWDMDAEEMGGAVEVWIGGKDA